MDRFIYPQAKEETDTIRYAYRLIMCIQRYPDIFPGMVHDFRTTYVSEIKNKPEGWSTNIEFIRYVTDHMDTEQELFLRLKGVL